MAEQVVWDRMTPPAKLLAEIDAGGVALVYPGAVNEDTIARQIPLIGHFILIDGTWHEARKIHQRSPYLQKALRIGLMPTGLSRYNLRKNQKPACLCTAECVIEILRNTGRLELAERLNQRFISFIRPAGAMRGAEIGNKENATEMVADSTSDT